MGFSNEPLYFNPDSVVSLIPGMTRSNMNAVEVELTCPFCGKRKYGLNRSNGLGHCFNANCPSDGRGYNIWQLYGAVYGLSNGEAIKELKSKLGMDKGNDSAESIPKRIVYQPPKTSEIATPENLHKVYAAFLQELTLTDKNRLDLRARGFSDETIEACGFKTFPKKDEMDFFALCRRLMGKGLTLKGVPGFFQCKNGSWCFIPLTKGIIMPIRDYADRIVGLQIRKDDDLRVCDEEGKLEAKCSWFSSKNSNNGCGAQAFVHFACDWIWDKELNSYRPYFGHGKESNSDFILTEGMMKAELIHQFWPTTPCMSVPGVDALYHLPEALKKIKSYGCKRIMLAFDMDYETNPNVDKAMERCKAIIKQAGLELWITDKGNDHLRWNTSVTVTVNGESKSYPLLKGLDDYLAYKKLGIVPEVKKF